MPAPAANKPRKHTISIRPDVNGEESFSDLVDAWPGDEVDLKLPSGLLLMMRVMPDGTYEYR